jgi:hypothetical protein
MYQGFRRNKIPPMYSSPPFLMYQSEPCGVCLFWKDLKCVVVVVRRRRRCRRRRRRRPSVPIEFPRKYISFNFMCRVSNNLRTTVAY